MAETIRIDGLRELRAKLLTLPAKIRDRELRGATGAAAAVIKDAAIANAPLRTGRLILNIIAARRHPEKHDEEWAITVRHKGKGWRQAFYWKFLEFGTEKMAARPFLRPAFEGNVGRAIEAFRARLAKRLHRLVGR